MSKEMFNAGTNRDDIDAAGLELHRTGILKELKGVEERIEITKRTVGTKGLSSTTIKPAEIRLKEAQARRSELLDEIDKLPATPATAEEKKSIGATNEEIEGLLGNLGA